MPLKLLPPGTRGPCWYIRGVYRGERCEYSTGTIDEAEAQAFLASFQQRFDQHLDDTEERRRREPERLQLGEFEQWLLREYRLLKELVVRSSDLRPVPFHVSQGYRVASLRFGKYRKTVREHRLKFLLAHGWLPASIDHVDRDGTNNEMANLRAATPAQQTANRSFRRADDDEPSGELW